MRVSTRFRGASALVGLLVGIAVPALAAWTLGGYQDPATGKVWSPSLYAQTGGSWSTWPWAAQHAADYVSTDGTGSYSDWRLPTVKELQTAVADGTINTLLPRNPDGSVITLAPLWTSETRGNKAWSVHIIVDPNTQQISGWSTVLGSKGDAWDAYFIRP
jgi:hypothetical protein